ncbi:MAG: hypothetical protein ACPG4N_02980, partial [Gammaproteobacteria bacterium]
REPATKASVGVRGAKLHNLKGVDLEVSFGQLTGICGPSGSGKSSLVMESFVPALRGQKPKGRWKSAVVGRGDLRVVVVDASPLGRTPSSIPATAVGLMGFIQIMAAAGSSLLAPLLLELGVMAVVGFILACALAGLGCFAMARCCE